MSKRIVLLSGGVGGARLARGLARLALADLTVVVNVGDDDTIYGLAVSPDLDTVLYTLAGIEGKEGWGLSDDGFAVMTHLDDFSIDTTFRIGDGDIATNLFRTARLAEGATLSQITAEIATVLRVPIRVLPATHDPIRTMIQTGDGRWRSFQDYFVGRRHEDEVLDLRFDGAAEATTAPGVLEAITAADAVIIGPSNPPLSIWPILAVPAIGGAVAGARRVMAVSPLFGGVALKGPAHRVLAELGYPPGNAGIVEAYRGILTDLVIDSGDAGSELPRLAAPGLTVHVADTRIVEPEAATALAAGLVERL